MTDLNFLIKEPVMAMLVKIWSYVPNLVAAIVILLVGWVLARVIAAVVEKILTVAKIDMAAEKAGLNDILAKGEVNKSFSEILASIVYWLIILVVIATAVQPLRLTVASELVSRLVDYVPNIIGAIFVLVFGGLLASFSGSIVQTAAGNAKIRQAKTLGQSVRVVITILTIAIALEQLRIGVAVIGFAVNILLASLGLGFAIAVGLGCKDLVARWVNNFVNSLKP
ncbi:MAG: hypothetical protein HY590_05690 [Candidatus Omnitrophica bacterium]|nr:hypothetical protein [Candidatus Omnitrophota bacterium]